MMLAEDRSGLLWRAVASLKMRHVAISRHVGKDVSRQEARLTGNLLAEQLVWLLCLSRHASQKSVLALSWRTSPRPQAIPAGASGHPGRSYRNSIKQRVPNYIREMTDYWGKQRKEGAAASSFWYLLCHRTALSSCDAWVLCREAAKSQRRWRIDLDTPQEWKHFVAFRLRG